MFISSFSLALGQILLSSIPPQASGNFPLGGELSYGEPCLTNSSRNNKHFGSYVNAQTWTNSEPSRITGAKNERPV